MGVSFHSRSETKIETVHSESPIAKKFRQTPSAGKVMATVFWDRKGILLIDYMETGTTINSDSYCATLRKLRRAIQNRRCGRLIAGVTLLHDNARPHVSRQTQELLTHFGWSVMPHPPHSPDLAPSDCHLFPKLKKHLSGQYFRAQRWSQRIGETFPQRVSGGVLRHSYTEIGAPSRKMCRKIEQCFFFSTM